MLNYYLEVFPLLIHLFQHLWHPQSQRLSRVKSGSIDRHEELQKITFNQNRNGSRRFGRELEKRVVLASNDTRALAKVIKTCGVTRVNAEELQ